MKVEVAIVALLINQNLILPPLLSFPSFVAEIQYVTAIYKVADWFVITRTVALVVKNLI